MTATMQRAATQARFTPDEHSLEAGQYSISSSPGGLVVRTPGWSSWTVATGGPGYRTLLRFATSGHGHITVEHRDLPDDDASVSTTGDGRIGAHVEPLAKGARNITLDVPAECTLEITTMPCS